MISTIDIRCNAAHPEMPLMPFVAFKTSPSSVRILDVPKKIGNWNITEVLVKVQYPDNSYSTKSCVRSGNVWVGTLDGTDTTGTVANGFTIGANGVDENGDEVSGYILGVGDVKILDADGSFHPEVKSFYLKILEDMPDDPKIGDSYFDGINQDILKTFNGYDWIDLGVDPEQYIHYGDNPVIDKYGVQRSVVLKNLANEMILNTDYLAVQSNGAGSSIYPDKIDIQNQITFTYYPNTDSVDAKIGRFKIEKNSSNGYDATLGKITLKTDKYSDEISIGSDTGTKTKYGQNGIQIIKSGSYNTTYLQRGYGQIIDDDNKGTLYVGSDIHIGYNATNNPMIKLGQNYVVDENFLGTVLMGYTPKGDLKNNKITITQGGVEKGSFTLNQGTDATIALDAGGGGSSKCLMNVSGIAGSTQYVSWTSGSDTFKIMRNDSHRLKLLKNEVEQTGYYGLTPIITEVDGNVSIYDNGYPYETNVFLDNVRQSSYSPLNTTGKKTLNICMDECLEQDTLITMADGTTKRVADLWIGDKVLTLNPDTLQLEEDEVLDCDGGILKPHNLTDIWNFSDGTNIKTVKPHQFFNTRTGKMEYIADFLIGDGVRKQDGTVITLVSHEQRRGLVYHNTLYTKNFNNYFANGILTGNRKSVKWGWQWIENNA